MSDVEARLQALEKEFRTLKDRQDILDIVSLHARGCDRFDDEILSGVYHERGFDEHGYCRGMRDWRDRSYHRPLTMEDGAHERW